MPGPARTGDPAFDLLAAIVNQWQLDARRDEGELFALAAFLEVAPNTLRERHRPKRLRVDRRGRPPGS